MWDETLEIDSLEPPGPFPCLRCVCPCREGVDFFDRANMGKALKAQKGAVVSLATDRSLGLSTPAVDRPLGLSTAHSRAGCECAGGSLGLSTDP